MFSYAFSKCLPEWMHIHTGCICLNFLHCDLSSGSTKPLPKRMEYYAGCIQCVQSSLSQNGGADLRSPCSGKFLKALKWWLKLPQLFPEIFGFAQRPIWWAAGRERQSPPSSLAGRRATEWQSDLASVFVLVTTFIFPDFCKIIFLPHLDLHCTALSIIT